jgi:mannonate dehydratase
MTSDAGRTPRPGMSPGRRNFLKLPLAVAAAGGLAYLGYRDGVAADKGQPPGADRGPRRPALDEYDPKNIKLAHRVSPGLSDDELLYLKQIGLRWARVEFQPAEATLDHLAAVQKRFAAQGIAISSAVNYVHRSLKIQLGQKGRDDDIEQYRAFLGHLGRLGIPVASYDFHPGNTYTTAVVERRGYRTREFDLDDFRAKVEKRRFEGDHPAEELWEHYAYFLKAVLPAAEKADVRLALHPDDPPVATMNGVAKLFTHYEGYRRAERLAGESRHWGLTFCVGTWAEGGERMGKDVFEMIADFGGRGKVFEVHLRNISGPLPHFVETFPDDGCLDLYRVVKALRQVGFSGAMEPDHVPQLAGDTGIRPAGTAYCIACLRALLRRANEEVG